MCAVDVSNMLNHRLEMHYACVSLAMHYARVLIDFIVSGVILRKWNRHWIIHEYALSRWMTIDHTYKKISHKTLFILSPRHIHDQNNHQSLLDLVTL